MPENLSGIFKALSDETRLRILKLLEHGELCVCAIVAALGISQPKVSFHLGALKEAGIIKDRKQGRWTHYRAGGEDMFRRLLIFSVFEGLHEDAWREDRDRLRDFLAGKNRGAAQPGAPPSNV